MVTRFGFNNARIGRHSPPTRIRWLSRVRLCTLGLLLFASSAQPLQAADAVEQSLLLSKGRQLLVDGNAQEALSWLNLHETEWLGTPDYDYLLGWAYYDAEQFDQSLFAMERLLMFNPDHVMARLTSVRIRIKNGQLTEAKEGLEALSMKPQNDAVQQQITELNSAIKQIESGGGSQGKNRIQGYARTTLGYDSNITSGPRETTVILPEYNATTPYELESSSADEDWHTTVDGAALFSHSLRKDTALTAGLALSQKFYQHRPDYDETVLTTQLGVRHKVDDELFALTVQGQGVALDDKVYQISRGFSATWKHPLTAEQNLTSYFQYDNLDYHDAAENDTQTQTVGVLHQFDPGAKKSPFAFYSGLRMGQVRNSNLGDGDQANKVLGAQLGGTYRHSDLVEFSLNGALERKRYGGVDSLYDLSREDDQRQLGLVVNYKAHEDWLVSGGARYIRNESNLSLYDYDRTLLSLSLQWNFDHAL